MPGRRTARGDGPPSGSDRPSADDGDARSTGEVIASLVVNAQSMLAKEAELLRLELKALVTRKLAAVATILVGALVAAGVLMLAAVTAAIALEGALPERWMAWGIVTLVAALVAVVLVGTALGMFARGWSLRSQRASSSTADWLRELRTEVTGGPAGDQEDRG
jgi:small-conductance mechanosensitive channel